METHRSLLTQPVGRLMTRYAVPCVISLLVGALYNIVDQIFIGRGVGYLGNGATSVVFPLTVLALALAVMVGDGACSYISIRLGHGDAESAARTVGSAVLLSLALAAALTALYFLFMRPLLLLFGGTAANMGYACAYFRWIAAGVPLYMLGNTLNPIIRADGSPRFAMAATLAGAILNVILDPIAIFGLHWGMMGAAAATVAGQALTAVLSVAYLFRMRSMKLTRASFRPSRALTRAYVPLGFCSFLSQLSVVLCMAATNRMLVKYGAQSAYGADIPLTVLGIVMKVFQIVISVTVGMAAGCIPIVGYNYGAGRNDRARGVLRRLIAAEALLGLIGLAGAELFPRQLIAVFGSGGALYEAFAVRTFRIYLCMLVLACVNKAAFIFLQSLGRPWLSTLLSLFREVALGVTLAILLPVFFGLDGILWSMPVSDVLAFAVSGWVLRRTDRQLDSNSENRFRIGETA